MKKRVYPNRDYYNDMFREYFNTHKDVVLNYTLAKLGYKSVEALKHEEFHGRFVGDCGVVFISPINKEQSREWRLDDGIDSYLGIHNPHYNTQSVMIMTFMTEKMLEDLGLSNDFVILSRYT